MQVDLMEARRDLTGSVWELIADSAVGTCHPVIDGGGRERRLTVRLEADVVEQGGCSEVCLGDVAGVVNALPPADEVQQAVSIAVEAFVRQAADILTIQEAVDPAHALARLFFDYANGAVCAGGRLFADYAELHGRAASSRE